MNINSKINIIFSVFALGLIIMLGQTVATHADKVESIKAAPLKADPVTPQPTSKPILAKISTPAATASTTHSTQAPTTECVERQDREVWGGPLSYGYTQAQADGLIYSYGVRGSGYTGRPLSRNRVHQLLAHRAGESAMKLTPRENELINYLVKHPTQTAQALGDHFSISTSTIRAHLRNIYKKFDLSGPGSKSQLIEMHRCRCHCPKICAK